MFIYNYSKNQLLNTAHITRLTLDAPKFEQKDWCVYCYNGAGAHLLYRGTETGCKEFIEEFRKKYS